MFNSLKQLLDWIYHRKCLVCKKTTNDSWICNKCFLNIEFNSILPIKKINGVKVYSAGFYKDGLQTLIREIKYRRRREVSKDIANFLYSYWQKLEESHFDYEIMPVPLHKKRARERDYNQCEEIAKEFSFLTGYEFNKKVLSRIKDTKPLYNLKVKERKEVIKNAFKVDKSFYTGKKVLLLDDIITTGTTLEEIIKELKKENIADITCLTVSARK